MKVEGERLLIGSCNPMRQDTYEYALLKEEWSN